MKILLSNRLTKRLLIFLIIILLVVVTIELIKILFPIWFIFIN